ncbi:MAG TPA: response regulator [Steroidobacteraceae bacterium]|jgi:signal transduction histidine kinase/DNA-binding response OmpR family regulator/HPt (histidine-containing phosphotransfer) domain-containing protein|nr:response regulator [Steroidobacteraceae bacterium]
MVSWIRNLSFAGKLRVMIFHAVTGALLLSFVLYALTQSLAARRDALRHLQTLADAVGENAALALARADRAQALSALRSLHADPLVRRAALYDTATAQLLADVDFPAPGAAAGRMTRAHLQRPVLLGEHPVGAIELDADLAPVYAQVGRSLESVLAALALVGFGAYFWSSRLRRFITVPVEDLVKVTRDVFENKNFAIRAQRGAHDEFGVLVDGFNRMLAELERRDRNLLVYQNQLERLVGERTVDLDRAVSDAQKAAKRAEEASRAKSDFLARMSHEIRTPMNGVLGMAELLSHSPKLDERQRRYVMTIRQSGGSLLEIINDILDFSKIEAGKLVLDHTGFCLRDVVEEAAEILAERASTKGLELICDIPPAMETAVLGDRVRLRQVIINLISNAVKFTERGEIKVKVRQIDPNLSNSVFRFEIEDTGIGIRPENCATIFESFAQEDISTTRQYGGTGLGLAICKQLVDAMGGEIGVESVPGKGSIFSFTLPLGPDPAAAPPRAWTVLRGAHVLLVDDNTTSRRILGRHLAAWGSSVVEAASSREALAILDKALDGEFGVMIIDSQMPEMSGTALAERIRALARFASVPLVMMQSEAVSNGARDLGRGPVAWMSKPVRQAQLHDRLCELLADDGEGTRKMKFAFNGGKTPSIALQGSGDFKRKVLLVEDNPVNAEVALAMLRELAVDADSVSSGETALERLALSRYDAVLMDCQMPKLDGYEATRRFRDWEQLEGNGRTPIIALTANALDGDAEKCYAAGMDRYLSKPFTLEQLRDVLGGCWPEPAAAQLVRTGAPHDSDAAAGAGADSAALDAIPAGTSDEAADEVSESAGVILDHTALERIKAMHRPGRTDLLTKVIGLYASNSTGLADALRTSALSGDANGLMRAAHALKSSSANVGAVALAELCRSIEAAAAEGRIDLAGMLVERFLHEHRRVLQALDQEIMAA